MSFSDEAEREERFEEQQEHATIQDAAICGHCGQREPVDRNGEFVGSCPRVEQWARTLAVEVYSGEKRLMDLPAREQAELRERAAAIVEAEMGVQV